MLLRGNGTIGEIDLDNQEHIDTILAGIPPCGKLIRTMDMELNLTGNPLSEGLQGRLFDFEERIVVIWTCGGAIDIGVFKKAVIEIARG